MPRRRDPEVEAKIAKAESDFQEALQAWISNNSDRNAWNTMYLLVYDCCINICKSKARNKHIDDLEGKALDATNYIMSFIRDRGARPEKLSSYCYMRCVKYLIDPAVQFYERNVVLETDYDYYTVEGNLYNNTEGDYDYAKEGQ